MTRHTCLLWLRQENKTKEVSELVNYPISQTNKQVNKLF